MGKETKRSNQKNLKKTINVTESSNSEYPAWMFDKLDRNGKFAFCYDSEQFDAKDFLDKVIQYSTMTWGKIIEQKHDENKSKHHYIKNGLSKDAEERIKEMELDEYTDSIFSFAFDNTLRIIGIREGRNFHVIWYDKKHEFCPSHKKHT